MGGDADERCPLDPADPAGAVLRVSHDSSASGVTGASSGPDEVDGRNAIRPAVAEGLAGLALIFAPLVRDIDYFAPIAAAGLVLLMIGAIVFHLRRREYPNIGLNIVLGVLAAVIAWGRFGPYRF